MVKFISGSCQLFETGGFDSIGIPATAGTTYTVYNGANMISFNEKCDALTSIPRVPNYVSVRGRSYSSNET